MILAPKGSILWNFKVGATYYKPEASMMDVEMDAEIEQIGIELTDIGSLDPKK